MSHIPWTKPGIFGIKWDNGPNAAATPLAEISRDEFLRLFFCGPWGLDGLNYGGWAPLPDTDRDNKGTWYTWQYFFFHRHALAIAERSMNTTRGAVLGEFLPDKLGSENGYDVKFYRLGCQHPNIQVGWVAMHDRRDSCPDCGFEAAYDSSG